MIATTTEPRHESVDRLRRYLIESESDEAVRESFNNLRRAVQAFYAAGRYREARAMLMFALGLRVRTRFVYETGKEEAAVGNTANYVKRLRGLHVISRPAFRQFAALVDVETPYTAQHVANLSAAVGRIAAEVKLPSLDKVAAERRVEA